MDPEATLDQIDVNGDIAETHHNAIESLDSGDTRLSFLKKAGLAGAILVEAFREFADVGAGALCDGARRKPGEGAGVGGRIDAAPIRAAFG